MSYNKTTWNNGDVITSQKMNNIQTGIEEISNASGGSSNRPTIYEFLLNTSGTGSHYAEGPTGLTYDDFAGVWIQFNRPNAYGEPIPYVLFPALRMQPEYDGSGNILYPVIGIWVNNPGDPPMYGQEVTYDSETGKMYIPD